MIQAPRLIGANKAFQSEPSDFLFEERVELHRPVCSTTPSRVCVGPFVHADENMMLESAHATFVPLTMSLEKKARERHDTGGFVLVSSLPRGLSGPQTAVHVLTDAVAADYSPGT